MGFSPVEFRLGEINVGAFESYAADAVPPKTGIELREYIQANGINSVYDYYIHRISKASDLINVTLSGNVSMMYSANLKCLYFYKTDTSKSGFIRLTESTYSGITSIFTDTKYLFSDVDVTINDSVNILENFKPVVLYFNNSKFSDYSDYGYIETDSSLIYYNDGCYSSKSPIYSSGREIIKSSDAIVYDSGNFRSRDSDWGIYGDTFYANTLYVNQKTFKDSRGDHIFNQNNIKHIISHQPIKEFSSYAANAAATLRLVCDGNNNIELADTVNIYNMLLYLVYENASQFNTAFNSTTDSRVTDLVNVTFNDDVSINVPTYGEYYSTNGDITYVGGGNKIKLCAEHGNVYVNNKSVNTSFYIKSNNVRFNSGLTNAIPNVIADRIDDYTTDIKFSGAVKDIYVYTENALHGTPQIPDLTLIHLMKDSPMETWCKNVGREYVYITDEDINGIKPSIEQNQKLFDSSTPKDISLTYDLGKKPAGADNISKVYLANENLKDTEFNIDKGSNAVTINADVLGKLPNGTYQVSVLFDNDTYTTGFSIAVMNSSVSGGGDSQKPPEALTMINYEFYKDHPDYIVIPIKMNGATSVTKLVVGTKEMPESTWELQDGAIILDHNELMNFDAGKYRVKPTFNDKENTTISNIQLIVYDSVSDRGAPFLLHQVIDFTGQTLRLAFDGGFGDIEANDVLALVVDDDIVLPNGDVIPFTSRNVRDIQKAREFVLDEDDSTIMDIVTENESDKEDDWMSLIATPSNATYATPSNASYVEDDEEFEIDLINDIEMIPLSHMRSTKKIDGIDTSLITAMSAIDMATDNVFWVEDRDIIVDGAFIESLNLIPGEHLIGAVFDNTEKTMDVKKVVLRIAEDKEDPSNPGTGDGGTGTDPSNPGGEGDKPTNPDGGNTGSGGSDKPTNPDGGNTDSGNDGGNTGSGGNNNTTNPDGSDTGSGGDGDTEEPDKRPSRPGSGGGSSGGSSSSGGGSSVIKPNPGHNTDGSYNTGYKPSIPNTGGSFVTDENGNKVYMFPDGITPAASWVADGKNWYYVEKNGMIRTDWFLDTTGHWYQLCKESGESYGAVIYGWYFEPADNKWYFLSPIDGHMLVGWQYINHKWYYMTETNNGPTYFGDNVTGWFYDPTKAWKPFGSMYCNEVTPDNYKVNESGEWVK